MAPPAPYRSYPPYQPLSTMGGSVLSNIHQPGGQMSMIPGMGVPQLVNVNHIEFERKQREKERRRKERKQKEAEQIQRMARAEEVEDTGDM
ncbi:hypothetical protein B0T10DRAFT_564884 [Thelonectria olida]|uniref:Uncharacterized protein n=1 Tax=Thelonectria olida TaxID=1576542 RepID=A0A9P8VXA4_9HYPO|nr:hypothetical protein B0T10DRAFT_564884 [Thelonectria olida]